MALFLFNTAAKRKCRRSWNWQISKILLAVLSVLSPVQMPLGAEALPETLAKLQNNYSTARSNHLASPGQIESAWKFARACFELADSMTNEVRLAPIAQEGIGAARFATEMSPTN